MMACSTTLESEEASFSMMSSISEFRSFSFFKSAFKTEGYSPEKRIMNKKNGKIEKNLFKII
jgi:hypothetical protein